MDKKRRSIDTLFWSDTYIDNLEKEEKLLMLYLITCPFSNMLGVYEIRLKQIALDTDLSLERVKEGLNKFTIDKKATFTEGFIILVNFPKHQSYNANMLKSAVNKIDEIPFNVRKNELFSLLVERLSNASEELGKGKVILRKIEKEKEYEKEDENEYEMDGSECFEPSESVLFKKDVFLNDSSPPKITFNEQDVSDEGIDQGRLNKVPIPETLDDEEFIKAYTDYMAHVQEKYRQTTSSISTEQHFINFHRWKMEGHDPVEIINKILIAGGKTIYLPKHLSTQTPNATKTNTTEKIDMEVYDVEH